MATRRALVMRLLFGTVLVAITPFNDFLVGATYIAGNHFPVGAFFVLLTLTLWVNVLLRRLASSLRCRCFCAGAGWRRNDSPFRL